MTTERSCRLQEFETTLTKGEKGLGFTVAGGQTSTGYFYVKDILYDPALKDGNMQRGDRIIRVSLVRTSTVVSGNTFQR